MKLGSAAPSLASSGLGPSVLAEHDSLEPQRAGADSRSRKLQLPNSPTGSWQTTTTTKPATLEVRADLCLSLHTLLGQRCQNQYFYAKSSGVDLEM